MYTKMTMEQITEKWNQLEAEQRERVEAVENAMRAVLHDMDRQRATLDGERQRLEVEKKDIAGKISSLQKRYRSAILDGNAEAQEKARTQLAAGRIHLEKANAALDALKEVDAITPAPALVEAVKEAQEAEAEARPAFNDARAEIRQALHQMAQEAETLNEKIGYSDPYSNTFLEEKYNRALSGQHEAGSNPETIPAQADSPRMGDMVRKVVNDPDTYYQQKRDTENRMRQ